MVIMVGAAVTCPGRAAMLRHRSNTIAISFTVMLADLALSDITCIYKVSPKSELYLHSIV